MVIDATMRWNDGADWVGVKEKKELDQGRSPGAPHAEGQQDLRVCCLPCPSVSFLTGMI